MDGSAAIRQPGQTSRNPPRRETRARRSNPRTSPRPGRAGRPGGAPRGSSITVGQVVAALDRIAPFDLASEWDNVGLLAGSGDWPVRRALLCIDLTDAVAQEALRRRTGLIVAYHPPIFRGIRRVTSQAEAPTGMLADLLAARVAVVALHTALDAAAGGTHDVLLDLFEPVSRWPLEPLLRAGSYKLVTFVPAPAVRAVRQALAQAGAGVIGHYRECSFELPGRGTFRGDETTRPAVGRPLRLERVAETRLEMVVPADRVGPVVRALYASHPYEEPAFDLYPLHHPAGRAQVGPGRVGLLPREQSGSELLERLRGQVDLSCATLVGSLERPFRSVTVAAGSFGVESLRDPQSLVITGELKHHDALRLLRRGITAICLGHWASERPVLDRLRQRLNAELPDLPLLVAAADRSPFAALGAATSAGPGAVPASGRKAPPAREDATRRTGRRRRAP